MKTTWDGSLILPKTIDNNYRGSPIAKYAFFVIVAFTIVRSFIHLLAPDGGASTIATIPLDSYSDAAANAVIYLFGVWGLSQLLMGVFYLIATVRWRSLIPLLYLFVVFEYAVRIIVGHFKPVEILGTAPGAVGNYVLVPLALVLFLLSIRRKAT